MYGCNGSLTELHCVLCGIWGIFTVGLFCQTVTSFVCMIIDLVGRSFLFLLFLAYSNVSKVLHAAGRRKNDHEKFTKSTRGCTFGYTGSERMVMHAHDMRCMRRETLSKRCKGGTDRSEMVFISRCKL